MSRLIEFKEPRNRHSYIKHYTVEVLALLLLRAPLVEHLLLVERRVLPASLAQEIYLQAVRVASASQRLQHMLRSI